MTSPARASRSDVRLTRRHLVAAGVASAIPFRTTRAQTPVARSRIPRVRAAVGQLPESLDPGRHVSLGNLWMDTLCLDAPNRWNERGDVIGAVVTTSISDDGEVMDLTLRPGAFFFDGTPVHADDVRDTIERVRHSPDGRIDAWRTEHISGIESVDASTVRIMLDRPDASLPASLAHPMFGIIPSATEPDDIRGGTGPFYLQRLSAGRIVYERNDHFWQIGRPHIAQLQVEAIEDDSRRTTAIATGEIDLLPGVPLLDIPMLQDEPTVYLVGGPSNRVCHLQVNLAVPELRDARVRRVLSRAIDRARLVDVATAGQGTPTGLLFGEDSWAYAGIDDVEQQSAEDVRAELRELGIPTDLRLRLLTDNSDATLANTAIVLQEQLASCGIALSVDLLDGDELGQAVESRDFDLLAGYTDPWRDPHELVRPLLASDGNRNRSGYVNEDVDVLMRGAILKRFRAFRQARYRRIEEVVQRDVPLIVLFHPHYFDAVSVDLAGYGALPPVTSRGLLSVRDVAGDA